MVRSPGGRGGGVMNKGPWTEAEDDVLSAYVKSHGEGNWRLIPKLAGLSRCGKSCRLRWINYLRPNLKHGNFSLDEDNLIITLHALLGNRWSLIAGRIPGRTDNEIKNYWNTHLRRKLQSMGIDPTSYKVGLTLLNDVQDNDGDDDNNNNEAPQQRQNKTMENAQIVSSPDSISTSTSYDSTSATSEPDFHPRQHLPCATSSLTVLSPQPLGSNNLQSWNYTECLHSSGADWEPYDQFRMEHLQLLDPLLEFSGLLQPLEPSPHVLWNSSGSLFDSLLD